jgi:LCP family protein required for cell wall assembly
MNAGRSAPLAALLSFLLPGLGQLYAGRPRRAVAFLVPALLTWGAILYALSQGPFGVLRYLVQPQLLTVLLVVNVALFALHALAVIDAWSLVRAGQIRRGAVPARARTGGGALGALALLLVATLVVHAVPEWYGLEIAVRLPRFLNTGGEPSGIPTPSWELTPTPTSGATGSPSNGPTPVPSGDPTTTPSQPPTQAPGFTPIPGQAWSDDGRLNVLLLGSDAGPTRWGHRPDAIHLLSVDIASGRAALFGWSRYTSNVPLPPESQPFFRDGRYDGYINAIYTASLNNPRRFPVNDDYGWGVMAGVVQELSGVKVDGYMVVSLLSFEEIVDRLGGLTIDVPEPVYDYGYGVPDGRGRREMSLDAGCNDLNGRRALFYARTRHQDGDVERLHRQHVTLVSMMRDYDPFDVVARMPDLLEVSAGIAYTSFTPDEFSALAELAARVNRDTVRSVVFEYPQPWPRNLKGDTVERMRTLIRGIFEEPEPEPQPSDC